MGRRRIADVLRKGWMPAMVAALAFAAPQLVSAQEVASAQTDSTKSMDQWKACLDGAAPSTQNVAPGSVTQATGQPIVLDADPHTDEIVFDFDDDVDNADIEAFARQHGLQVRLNSTYSDAANIFVARVDEGAVPYIKDCLAQKAPAGLIEAAEENINYAAFGSETADDTAPNDPLYQFQWNFKQVGAESAWKVSTGRDVTVAVIDTGVAMENAPDRGITRPKDLDGTEGVAGYDFVDDDDFAWDGHGHGTHVAGTIAQTTNNEYGVAGLAYNAKIMPLRVLNSRGFGQVSDIADAVRFAADNDAQVINMSLGGPLPSLVLSRAIKYAYNKGVTIVAAAGNGGKRAPSYPAAYDGVIAVAATQFDKNTTFYSQWGKYVDIAAPGGNTRVDQNGDGRPDGVMQQTLKNGATDEHDFVLYMGTSMASPHVAAGAALIISQGVTHPDQVEEVLQDTADDSLRDRYDDEKEFRERYGAGLMQADEAAQSAATTQGTWRFAGGLFLALLALVGVRRKDILGVAGGMKPSVIITSVVTASGLFFLPMLIGDGGCFGGVVSALSHPLAELDLALFGPGAHQNPLLASFLIPLLAVGLLGGHDKIKYVASGLALGMAGFLLTESVLLTSDVQWIPGMNVLDRVWLGFNGLVSFAIGYFSLKRV
ncbi:S8 family serine peptidase [Persicimonas caeni]|nr:S8 family serine peptidase [Persicimonas caeni]